LSLKVDNSLATQE